MCSPDETERALREQGGEREDLGGSEGGLTHSYGLEVDISCGDLGGDAWHRTRSRMEEDKKTYLEGGPKYAKFDEGHLARQREGLRGRQLRRSDGPEGAGGGETRTMVWERKRRRASLL